MPSIIVEVNFGTPKRINNISTIKDIMNALDLKLDHYQVCINGNIFKSSLKKIVDDSFITVTSKFLGIKPFIIQCPNRKRLGFETGDDGNPKVYYAKSKQEAIEFAKDYYEQRDAFAVLADEYKASFVLTLEVVK